MRHLHSASTLLLLVISLFSTLLFACASQDKTHKFETSGVNSKFNFDTNKTFPQYIEYSRQIIESGRVDLNLDNKKQIIAWNSPFALYPDAKNCTNVKKRGILLIHGLLDSPFTTKAMANYFSNNCFTVYSLLLSGHGTRSGDLLDVSYKDWIKQVEYGVNELSKVSDDIYLGGISTGGALAVNYVLSNPSKKIEGIIGLSPALTLPWKARLAPFVKYFKKWNSQYSDDDIVKYESLAMNGASQIYLLTKEINKQLETNNNPLKNTKVFMALSYEDQTIDPKNTLNTILNNTDPNNRHIVLYHQNNLPQDISSKTNLFHIQSSSKKDRIFDLAHISISNDPQNVWYGKNGKYRDCLSYYNHKDKNKNYSLCKSSDDINRGEITKNNLSKGVMARLSYNPFIANLLSSLGSFLEI